LQAGGHRFDPGWLHSTNSLQRWAVLPWCLRETGNREIAADLSAEVFAAALISARRYRPGQGWVLAWLLGIARNELLESRRRTRVEDSARCRLRLDMKVASRCNPRAVADIVRV
jgi:DNA-directed RNA polymerase specialized sigma24 family protein